MYQYQILGSIVRRLREMVREGASVTAVLRYLEDRCGANTRMPFHYLREAFPADGNYFFMLAATPIDPATEEAVRSMFGERRSEWENKPFPELIRLRDYIAFMQFVRDTDCVAAVCGADPQAAPYVGAAGFRCYDGKTFVMSARRGPMAGLLTAAPHDAELHEALSKFSRAVSYDQYARMLSDDGYRILGQAESHAIVDADGNRLYLGYRLHSVYDPHTGETAWCGARATALQRRMNALLGHDLVKNGPHDDWVHRNDQLIAGPLSGPQTPLIEFHPDGTIRNFLDFDALLRRSDEDRWRRLYPGYGQAATGPAR